MLKLNIVGRRRPGTLLNEHRHHIRQVHGELVREYIETDPDHAPKRYVQNVVIDGTFRGSVSSDDPFRYNRDFVTQVWVEDFAALERSRNTAFYQNRLRDDEGQFVDQGTVVFLPCNERQISIVDGASLPEFKLFVLFQRADGIEAKAFGAAWTDVASATATNAIRHVQNDVTPARGADRMPADAIDEFWFENESDARAHATNWTSLIESSLVAEGLAVPHSIVVLIAREDSVHAGAVAP